MNEDRKIDEAFLTEMMKRGEKAWKDVPDATAWVEDLRTDMTQNKMSDTPTPRTQAARSNVDTYADQYLFSHSTDGEWVRYEVSEQLERELAEVTKQRDHYKKACNQYSEDEMLCKLQEVTKQRDEWKANHDNQVAINRALRDRPDLGERAKLVDALTKQRDALAEALQLFENCFDCYECTGTAEKALAATKGEKP